MRRALWGALGEGREKEGELTTTISGIWIAAPIPPWLPFDWSVRFPPISSRRKRARMQTNIEKHVPRVMTSLLMSSPPIRSSHRLPFSAPLPERPGELARWLGNALSCYQILSTNYLSQCMEICHEYVGIGGDWVNWSLFGILSDGFVNEYCRSF